MSGDPSFEAHVDAAAIGQRHGVPADAVTALIVAIRRGGGRQAQFSHPALGGMGQWSRGGGTMIGDMFDHSLKAKVEQLCNELAKHFEADRRSVVEHAGPSRNWWPDELGQPASVGSQNEQGYACFPERRRLAIRDTDGVHLYDTGDHQITGVSQQQGGSSDLCFRSQHGTARLSDFAEVKAEVSQTPSARYQDGDRQLPSETREMLDESRSAAPAHRDGGDVLALLEQLYELQRKGVLTSEEFAAKKTELLARL